MKVIRQFSACVQAILLLSVVMSRAQPSDAQIAVAKNVTGDPDAERFDRSRIEAMDIHVQNYLRAHRIPGVAISVVHGTNLIFAKGFGEGITANTPFKLASVSKSFTAVAIMQLVEAGKLDLDAPVRRYLPWFQTDNVAESGKITLRHLLHHLSGLSTRDGRIDPSGVEGDSVTSLVRTFRHLHLTASAGSRFQYSNANYDVLGAVVEAMSRMEFGSYVKTYIFDPLEMNSSYVSLPEARQLGLIGHRYWFGFPIEYPHDDHCAGRTASAGLVSTAEDLAHYTTALINGGSYKGHSLLSSNGVATLFRTYSEGGGPPAFGYAMGWWVPENNDVEVRLFSHEGRTSEFFSSINLLPDHRLAVSFLVNADSFTRMEIPQLALDVTRGLLGMSAERIRSNRLVACATWMLLLLPIVQLLGLWRTLWLLRKWRSGNPPRSTWASWVLRWGLPLIGHLAVAAVTLWQLPRAFDLSLPRLLVFVPDYGCLAAFSGGFALMWGIVRSVCVGCWMFGNNRKPPRTVAEAVQAC